VKAVRYLVKQPTPILKKKNLPPKGNTQPPLRGSAVQSTGKRDRTTSKLSNWKGAFNWDQSAIISQSDRPGTERNGGKDEMKKQQEDLGRSTTVLRGSKKQLLQAIGVDGERDGGLRLGRARSQQGGGGWEASHPGLCRESKKDVGVTAVFNTNKPKVGG